ncbi:hypothetical protein CMO89_03825 [Candidatus Woesearchaeota archaeon]|nr:hypothetical protein [Candidatus Woesearchaeota archaeon]
MTKKKEAFSYDVLREGEDVILRVDCEKYTRVPSLEDDPTTMSKTCDILAEVGHVTKIVYVQKRDYEYDSAQTAMLTEIARLYNQLVKQKIINYYSITEPSKYAEIQNILFNLLKKDPLVAYVEVIRIHRREKSYLTKATNPKIISAIKSYISLLEYIIKLLEKTKLVTIAKSHLAGYKPGDRSAYRRILNPAIKPDFIFTRLMASYPRDGEELDAYLVGDTEVTIFKLPDTIQSLYHVIPPEFKLSEQKYELVDAARRIMSEHKPKKSEFVDPERMREVFFNVGHDLIEELASYRNLRLRTKEINELTKVLVRYTVGFGLIELLLQDEKVQDITINSPMGQIPIFLIHQDYDDCKTNIVPTVTEAESWASKLRMISGRPLDEANPILDTELILPGASSRICVVGSPLNPSGLAYAFRRHRDKPWTLPLFVNNRMINSLGAGIISFLVDGSRTMLVAGTRSSGKTSLLGSVLTEIMRKYRIISIEDTLELPVIALRKLGYNVQPMKVAAAMTKGSAEVPADEGIRTTLRMGDSCLIVGEVRSTETLALYEAMRVGALANVVAGTIHGDSPYGVFDRVVNDLGVPRTSFKATDIIVVANPIKSADGLHRWRRVTQITEVRKHWEKDPMLEKGFVDLMKYDSISDELKPSDDLINGESDILKSIAGNVKEWAGNWDAVWDNIQLRAKIKQTLVDYANNSKNLDLLEAPFVIQSNDEFHRISDKVKEEVGNLDSKKIFFEWDEWVKRAIKRKGVS